jgi:hypothetical protein
MVGFLLDCRVGKVGTQHDRIPKRTNENRKNVARDDDPRDSDVLVIVHRYFMKLAMVRYLSAAKERC